MRALRVCVCACLHLCASPCLYTRCASRPAACVVTPCPCAHLCALLFYWASRTEPLISTLGPIRRTVLCSQCGGGGAFIYTCVHSATFEGECVHVCVCVVLGLMCPSASNAWFFGGTCNKAGLGDAKQFVRNAQDVRCPWVCFRAELNKWFTLLRQHAARLQRPPPVHPAAGAAAAVARHHPILPVFIT